LTDRPIHIQFHYKPRSITTDDDLGLRLDMGSDVTRRDLTPDMGDFKSDGRGAEIPGSPI